MARRLIGIDFGSGSIKTAILPVKGRGPLAYGGFYGPAGAVRPDDVQVENVEVHNRTDPFAPANLDLLARHLARRRQSSDELIVGVPGDRASVRFVRFPFADPHKIALALPLEMEGLLPFPLEDVVLAHRIVSKERDGALVFAAAVPRAFVDDLLQRLRERGMDPKKLILTTSALADLAAKVLAREKERGLLVLDIGCRKTELVVLDRNGARVARTVPWGTDRITAALTAKGGVRSGEAEGVLRALNVHGTGEREKIAQEAMTDLAREGTLTLESLPSGVEVRSLWVCGGGSAITGMATILAEAWGLDVASPKAGAGPMDVHAMAVALGLEGSSGFPAAGVDFRTGPYAYAPDIESARGRRLAAGAMVAVLLLAGAVDLGIRYGTRRTSLARLDGEIQRIFSRSFPKGSSKIDPLLQMRALVADLRKKTGQLGRAVPVVHVLKLLTDAVPADLGWEVQELSIDGTNVRAEATVGSYDAVDRIRQDVARVAEFRDVAVSDANAVADTGKIRFHLAFSIGDGSDKQGAIR